MKLVITKSIKVSSDGTISFFSMCLKSIKQVNFHEKDSRNSMFSKKFVKNKMFQNSPNVSYKSKYKV